MPVTARKLRRLHASPAAVKVGAGVLAGAIGMTTAAYGVLQFVAPFKGNGARSEARPAAAEPVSPTAQLTDLLLALVPSEAPVEGGEQSAFLVDSTGQLVTSVVDVVNGSPNGVVTPGSGSGSGGTGGSGGSGGGLLNLGGGSGGGGNGGAWTPPGGGGESQGVDVPGVAQFVPPVTVPDLALEGQEEDPCAQDEASSDPSLIDPHLPGRSAPEQAEEPACTEEEAPASEEQPPAEENPGN